MSSLLEIETLHLFLDFLVSYTFLCNLWICDVYIVLLFSATAVSDSEYDHRAFRRLCLSESRGTESQCEVWGSCLWAKPLTSCTAVVLGTSRGSGRVCILFLFLEVNLVNYFRLLNVINNKLYVCSIVMLDQFKLFTCYALYKWCFLTIYREFYMLFLLPVFHFIDC